MCIRDRLGNGQAQRADRRNPADAHPDGFTHFLQVNGLRFSVYVAHVEKPEHAQCPVIARSGEWCQHFEIQVDLAVAAQAATGCRVDLSQAALFESTHRTQTAAVEVLEQRERTAGQALALACLLYTSRCV